MRFARVAAAMAATLAVGVPQAPAAQADEFLEPDVVACLELNPTALTWDEYQAVLAVDPMAGGMIVCKHNPGAVVITTVTPGIGTPEGEISPELYESLIAAGVSDADIRAGRRTPYDTPAEPDQPDAFRTAPLTTVVKIDPVDDADFYVTRCGGQVRKTYRLRVRISLETRRRIECKVRAVNEDGTSTWSDTDPVARYSG